MSVYIFELSMANLLVTLVNAIRSLAFSLELPQPPTSALVFTRSHEKIHATFNCKSHEPSNKL